MAGVKSLRGALARSRDPRIGRYLLDGERIVIAVHQHWGAVAWPIAAVAGGLVLALWVDGNATPTWHFTATILWWLWFALVAATVWRLLQWRNDWFIATDKRLLLTYGIVTRRVAMMPLAKVTDMSYVRSTPGRVFGYGQFVLESAGQDQALRQIDWVPDPDRTYRVICAEIFGVEDHDRVLVEEGIDPYAGDEDVDDLTEGGGADHPGGLHTHTSPVQEEWRNSTAIPLHLTGEVASGEVLYNSTQAAAARKQRNREADTGELPITRGD